MKPAIPCPVHPGVWCGPTEGGAQLCCVTTAIHLHAGLGDCGRPVARAWQKSLAGVLAAMWCQGHRFPLELEEAVKGLRLPWRHCSDPFSELISEMEKILPLWGFFHQEREGSGGGGCGDCEQCCHLARQQQKGTYFGRRGLIPQADLCLAVTTAIGLFLSK